MAVCLDAAGTLLTVAQPVGQTYSMIAARHGVALSPDDLSQGFRSVFPDMPALGFGRRFDQGASDEMAELDALERGWWRRLVLGVVEWCTTKGPPGADRLEGASGSRPDWDFDRFFDELYAYYESPRAWALYPETLEVLDRLRERAIRTAVVSNFDTRLEKILPPLGVTERVDTVICSTRAGAAKPDAAIFGLALERLGSLPSDTLHVGDNVTADLEGARSAALHALLIDRDKAPAGHRIATLHGVLDWLDAQPGAGD